MPSSLPATRPAFYAKTSGFCLLRSSWRHSAFLAWVYLLAEAPLYRRWTARSPQLRRRIAGRRDPGWARRSHHYAASLDDLLFAQGYVTAQDRLWQMDVMRRFAAGDLAEISRAGLMSSMTANKRFLGMRVAARKAIEVASPQVREHYEAYVQG